jgi:uncharacterized membrane protein
MNKQDYLRLLKQQMSHLDEDTSLEIMAHVLSVFDRETAKGRTEREIIAGLGNPSKYVSTYQNPPINTGDADDTSVSDDSFKDIPEETLPADDLSEIEPDNQTEPTNDVTQPEKTTATSNTSSVFLRFLLGLMIGLPILLIMGTLVLAGISVAAFAFLQGLIMTFDLPYRIWQLPFSVREDFSLLVGVGLIMVASGLITLFISALIGIYHGFKNLFKGNFRSAQ